MDIADIASITLFQSFNPPHELSADEVERIKRGEGADWLHELRRTRENMTRFVYEPPLASELLGGQHSLGADYRGPSEINAQLDAQIVRLDKHRERTSAQSNGDKAPAFSDEALALNFAERHGPDLRYVAKWGRWLSWAETHWQPDDTLHAFDLARQIIREAATAYNKSKKVAVSIASAKTVASVERLAKSDRRLAATVDQWDGDLTILNTPTKGK